jgi:quercetin dioxygenase-like cupin family protein
MIIQGQTVPWIEIDDHVSRRVLQSGDTLMLVEFCFRKGGIGAVHSHEEHEQVGYIIKGRFEVRLGQDTRIIGPGDSYYAARNVPHGVVALEDGVIVDAFTPIRQDF